MPTTLKRRSPDSLQGQSADYRSGYGQARADLLKGINEAFQLTDRALHDANATKQTAQAVDLKARLLALRWVRALVKAI